MRTLLLTSVLLLPATARAEDLVVAPPTPKSSGCDLSIVGAKTRAPFEKFFADFQAAVRSGDAAKVAKFVAYPLHVNVRKESHEIAKEADFVAKYPTIFTPSIVAAVTEQAEKELFCRDLGVMFGGGQVWVSLVSSKPERYGVQTVNVPDRDAPPLNRPAVLFRCNAPKHLAIVDDAKGGARYRAWTKPNGENAKPDLELADGKAEVEGTGACAHSIWTFSRGKVQYVVSELGCTEGSEPPGTVGTLTVVEDGKETAEWYCGK